MKTFHPEPLEAVCYREKTKQGNKNIKFEFVKKTSIPHPVESLTLCDISSATARVALNLVQIQLSKDLQLIE